MTATSGCCQSLKLEFNFSFACSAGRSRDRNEQGLATRAHIHSGCCEWRPQRHAAVGGGDGAEPAADGLHARDDGGEDGRPDAAAAAHAPRVPARRSRLARHHARQPAERHPGGRDGYRNKF